MLAPSYGRTIQSMATICRRQINNFTFPNNLHVILNVMKCAELILITVKQRSNDSKQYFHGVFTWLLI